MTRGEVQEELRYSHTRHCAGAWTELLVPTIYHHIPRIRSIPHPLNGYHTFLVEAKCKYGTDLQYAYYQGQVSHSCPVDISHSTRAGEDTSGKWASVVSQPRWKQQSTWKSSPTNWEEHLFFLFFFSFGRSSGLLSKEGYPSRYIRIH